MKKVLFITLAGMMLFASCRKSRTCVCKYANGYIQSETYPLSTKKEAQSYCDDNVYAGVSCELD